MTSQRQAPRRLGVRCLAMAADSGHFKQEGVRRTFCADRRARSMAWEDLRVIVHRQDLVTQGGRHLFHASTRKVSATDRAGEQHIAAEAIPRSPIVTGQPEQDGTRRVPGGVINRDVQSRQFQALSLGERDDVVGLGPIELSAESTDKLGRQALHRILKELRIVGMDARGDFPGATYRPHRKSVVQVPVRHQYRRRLQVVPLQYVVELAANAHPRVDNDALRTRLRCNYITIRTERFGD